MSRNPHNPTPCQIEYQSGAARKCSPVSCVTLEDGTRVSFHRRQGAMEIRVSPRPAPDERVLRLKELRADIHGHGYVASLLVEPSSKTAK